MKDIILETSNLTKEFKGFVAVNDVSLSVQRGQIHALIGPQRAARSNLMVSTLRATALPRLLVAASFARFKFQPCFRI